MTAKRKLSGGLNSRSSSETKTLGSLGASGKKSPIPKKPTGKKTDNSVALAAVAVSAAVLVIILIVIALLPGGGENENTRIKRAEQLQEPKTQDMKLPDVDPRPSQDVPAGQIGDWAKSVVYIEGGNVSMADNKFNKSKSGSGFVISSSGELLTNYHVIEGISVIVVTFYNGTWKIAEVVKYDKELDAALLRTELPNDIQPLKLSADINIGIGRRILVMGFPLGKWLGKEMTLTDGLISSIRHNDDRSVEWYQISAPVNPGNSGGPLLDEKSGEVLGIVTAKIINAERIGFARPVSLINNLLQNSH